MNWRQYAFPAAILGIAAIVGIVVLIANSGGDDDGRAASACRDVEQPQPKPAEERKRPALRLDPDKTYRATVKTSCGTFVDRAGLRERAEDRRLLRDARARRVLRRPGVPSDRARLRGPGRRSRGDGTGGPGYKIREAPPKDVVYSEGVVAMAKGGDEPAGTSGSQFFVVTGNETGLPPDYAVLGKVEKGMRASRRSRS